MIDKAKLGTRYVCFQCGCKFYDLNRPVPSCPDCGADQREAPVQDLRALLGKTRARLRAEDDDDEFEGGDDIDIDEDEDDDLGLDDLGDDDEEEMEEEEEEED